MTSHQEEASGERGPTLSRPAPGLHGVQRLRVQRPHARPSQRGAGSCTGSGRRGQEQESGMGLPGPQRSGLSRTIEDLPCLAHGCQPGPASPDTSPRAGTQPAPSPGSPLPVCPPRGAPSQVQPTSASPPHPLSVRTFRAPVPTAQLWDEDGSDEGNVTVTPIIKRLSSHSGGRSFREFTVTRVAAARGPQTTSPSDGGTLGGGSLAADGHRGLHQAVSVPFHAHHKASSPVPKLCPRPCTW